MTTAGESARRPKVLFLSGLQVHPTVSGGTLRSFALATALQRHGLDVFVYSMVGRKKDYLARRPSSVQAWPSGIEEHVDRGLFGFLAQFGSYRLGLPPLWLTAWLRAAALSPGEALLPRLLRERLAWCDVLVADFPFVFPVFSAPSASGALRVLSTHNLEHQLYGAAGGTMGRILRGRVRAVEVAAAAACDLLVGCCEGDLRFFEAQARVRRSVLVANGIDPVRFRGIAAHRGPARQALGISDDTTVFLFTASKYGPNREAFEYLVEFAHRHAELLAERRMHILVVGNVVADPVRRPGFTATGRVDAVEPYFAAADAALNPMWSGAGTNVKICEFIAMRLPVVTSRFGARGFDLEDGRTAILCDRDTLAAALSDACRMLREDPERARRMADEAYTRNEAVIDMDSCVQRLVEAIGDGRARPREAAPEPALTMSPRSECL